MCFAFLIALNLGALELHCPGYVIVRDLTHARQILQHHKDRGGAVKSSDTNWLCRRQFGNEIRVPGMVSLLQWMLEKEGWKVV